MTDTYTQIRITNIGDGLAEGIEKNILYLYDCSKVR